ncbi:MAG: SPFH domain-containing protein, partial [Candidatus Bathyarchaeota archaeon]|nr:SPFH domain-containing protein [Candidatus Bathyarchaeota archaeon]
MLLEIVLTLLIILIATLAILSAGIRKVNQYERGVIEKWNAYEKTVDPGLHYILPVVRRIFRVNMREQVIDVPPQEIITEDNVVVTIDAVVYYQIMDPTRALY